MTTIHITVDLEAKLREEIDDMKAMPLLGATSEKEWDYQRGWISALRHVLHLAHAELDD